MVQMFPPTPVKRGHHGGMGSRSPADVERL